MQIKNIEVSGICNLRCDYCPYPKMKIKRGFMNRETLNHIIKVLKKQKTKDLGLEVFGEPLLHPDLPEFVRELAKVVPKVKFYTNGTLLTRDICIKLKEAGLHGLYVSLHKPEIEDDVLKAVEGLDIFMGFVKVFTHNWAGKVDKEVDPFVKNRACPYIFRQRGTIRWNGDIVNCDMDAGDTNILGNIKDTDIEKIKLKSFDLCKTCHFKSENFNLMDKLNYYKTNFRFKAVLIIKKVVYGYKI